MQPAALQGPVGSTWLQVHGGAPYGAGTYAGADNLRQPTEFELGYAKHQARLQLGLIDY